VLADRYVALGRWDDAELELVGLIADMNSHKARKALAELKLDRRSGRRDETLVKAILEADEHMTRCRSLSQGPHRACGE
jgi:hypothetical protein